MQFTTEAQITLRPIPSAKALRLRHALDVFCGFSNEDCPKSKRASPKLSASRSGGSLDVNRAVTDVLSQRFGSFEHEVQAVVFAFNGLFTGEEDLSSRTGEETLLGQVPEKREAKSEPQLAKQLSGAERAQGSRRLTYGGALALARACRKAGLKTAIIQGPDKADIDLRTAAFGASSTFDVTLAAGLSQHKPVSDAFIAASETLGVPHSKCVVLTDALEGIQAAQATGMRSIGLASSLSEVCMAKEQPNLVCRDISSVTLEDVLRLTQTARPVTNRKRSLGLQSYEPQAGWIDKDVELPLGGRTTRRELLKVLPLIGAVGAGYSLLQNAKALSYISPQALLRALSPNKQPQLSPDSEEPDRVASFKRYIASRERRNALEAVPEFPQGSTWFNSPPLKLTRDLRGRVLIYDFWTYCCINCMHILPSLAALEAKYRDQPVSVIGVHSAKFDNEKEDESIRSAILRYGISHPCVNDSRMVLWRDLGISSWPTLAVVSPRGQLIAALPGEGNEENIDAFIQASLEYYGERGQLRNDKLPTELEREKDSRVAASPLHFPGKLAADLASNRLFISDSSNNRVVVTDLEGTFIEQIGGKGANLRNGSFEDAAFRRPQGVVYSARQNVLFVADTENHALRKVDLNLRTVSSLAGNGSQGRDYRGGGKGHNQQLSSPWDLALSKQEDAVYIALAGQHQIWRHNLASGITEQFSGDGSERNSNGSRDRTAWAQPSGLSLSPDGRTLWVADSESSSIRSLSTADGSSQAHVGGDSIFSENLFQFGDRDDRGSDARLQHPLAVCCLSNGNVIVADSYNHRLKILETGNDSIRSLAGSGTAGFADGSGAEAQLSEPGGLCSGPDGSVLVADTNNSVIRKLSPGSGELTTLELKGVPAEDPSNSELQPTEALPSGAALVVLDPVRSSNGELSISIKLPSGFHLTKGANSHFEATATNAAALSLQPRKGPLSDTSPATATLQYRRAAGTTARIKVTVYFCQQDYVCLFEEVVFEVPFRDDMEGEEVIALEHSVSSSAAALKS